MTNQQKSMLEQAVNRQKDLEKYITKELNAVNEIWQIEKEDGNITIDIGLEEIEDKIKQLKNLKKKIKILKEE